MVAVRPSASARQLIALRRSASKHHLSEPGPSPSEIDDLLKVATRVPDHRRLEPWRFIVFEGDARVQFGQKIAEIYGKKYPDAESQDILTEAGRLLRAPIVIVVVSNPKDDGKTPTWEQEMSAGALCQNLLLAANAAGWAGVWLTEWITFDEDVNQLLGLAPLERVAGYIYLGTATIAPTERPRADMSSLVQRWSNSENV